MCKYRKKPVVIEAVQLTWQNWNKVCEFVSEEAFGGGVYLDENMTVTENTMAPHIGMRIKTLEGEHLAIEGDYIIKGVAGEFYPCKPDIFDQTYEKV